MKFRDNHSWYIKNSSNLIFFSFLCKHQNIQFHFADPESTAISWKNYIDVITHWTRFHLFRFLKYLGGWGWGRTELWVNFVFYTAQFSVAELSRCSIPTHTMYTTFELLLVTFLSKLSKNFLGFFSELPSVFNISLI